MPALIEATTLPDDPGCTGYLITAGNPGEVQDAITAILNTVEDRGGEAHFRTPARSFLEGHMRWRSTGFVRELTPCAQACADVQAYINAKQAAQ